MSIWNYRVIASYQYDIPFYSIRECYYNNEKDSIPRNWTATMSHPIGGTADELKKDIEMMLQAFNKPVLVEEFNSDGEAERLVEK